VAGQAKSITRTKCARIKIEREGLERRMLGEQEEREKAGRRKGREGKEMDEGKDDGVG